jgi:hypothetical protein
MCLSNDLLPPPNTREPKRRPTTSAITLCAGTTYATVKFYIYLDIFSLTLRHYNASKLSYYVRDS